jgi:hypothetical protein
MLTGDLDAAARYVAAGYTFLALGSDAGALAAVRTLCVCVFVWPRETDHLFFAFNVFTLFHFCFTFVLFRFCLVSFHLSSLSLYIYIYLLFSLFLFFTLFLSGVHVLSFRPFCHPSYPPIAQATAKIAASGREVVARVQKAQLESGSAQ